MPEISVIIPWMGEQLLTRAVSSVVAQSVPCDIIVIDDRSPNLGLAEARNVGVRRSRTPWLVMLDADDELRPTALEKLWEAHLANPEAQVIAQSTGAPLGADILQHNYVFGCGALISYRAWQKAGEFEQPHRTRQGCEDWLFWIKCFQRHVPVVCIPDALYVWHRRKGSMSDWDSSTYEMLREAVIEKAGLK